MKSFIKQRLPFSLRRVLRPITESWHLRRIAEQFQREEPRPVTDLERAVAEAVALASRARPVAEADARWIDRIERRRRDLETSSEQLEWEDFGTVAGGSDEGPCDGMTPVRRPIRLRDRAFIGSRPRPWAYLLHLLTRAVRPAVCLELGTCVGISGAYLAAAMQENGKGRLVTLEGSQALADVAAETFASLGLDEIVEIRVGPFLTTLAPLLASCELVGLAFIDGHHDGEATIRYFHQILERSTPTALFVFDDIRQSPGMLEAWRQITESRAVSYSADLEFMGIAIAQRDR